MLPNLFIGDYLLVAKWPYGYSRYSFPFGIPPFDGPDLRQPAGARRRRRLPPAGEGDDFIKRVIGLPGDTIEVRGGAADPQRPAAPPRAGRNRSSPHCRPTALPEDPDAAASRRSAGKAPCRYPAFRETLPGGRSYTVLDQVAPVPPTISRRSPCPPAICS